MLGSGAGVVVVVVEIRRVGGRGWGRKVFLVKATWPSRWQR